MTRQDDGLKSEALLAALNEALAGKYARLEDLLGRHGNMPSPKPNLKLAQAFGAELASAGGQVVQLLKRFTADDAAPDTAQVFLPIAASHGWVHRLREHRDVEPAWAALEELCADERGPVRVGAADALVALASREGWADKLVERAGQWLQSEDRELRFGAAALVVEVLGHKLVMAGVRDGAALLAYLAGVIDSIADAPRAAERSEGRRRALTSLSLALPTIVASLRADDQGLTWLLAECERNAHPDVRRVLSDTIVKLHEKGETAGALSLRAALVASAKPLRDPTLVRKGTGRGKQTRRTR